MSKYYSETLDQALNLLYFQADPDKFPEGVRMLEQAVNNGEADASYFLARCYAWGDGNVKYSGKKARQLSKRGIEQGSDLCVLGADRMDELKGNVKEAMTKPLKQSFEAVLKMAEDGEPMAQYAIGLFYFWGDMYLNFQAPVGIDLNQCKRENALEALKWFRLSAVQGCLPAFRNAFNIVIDGTNVVPTDLKGALDWMETVADRVDLRDYYYSIALSYSQLKDYAQMSKWAQIGIENQDSACAVKLGNEYLYGNIGGSDRKENYREAVRYFEMAADWGSEYGFFNLGRCYYNGWGCERNYVTAVVYFEKAYRMGHRGCQSYLAQCYYWGKGVEQDQEMSFRLIQELIRAKMDYPKEILGLCYLYGKGTLPDYPRARQLLAEAAPDCPQVWKELGDMFDRGLGGPEDVEKAVSCYQKAAAAGAAGADEALGRYKKTLFGKWKRKA